ncbi:MAG: metallophosphoesterase [Clostridiales bacterium]|nr:metallophosphoesterase [Clostridiales bacterium]
MSELRIIVISDTHGHVKDIDYLMKDLEDVDYIIHTGDYINDAEYIIKKYDMNVIAVVGNCDFNFTSSREIVKNIGNKVFFITHGHEYNVKYDLNRIFYRGKELGADIVLFGHSHVPSYNKIDEMILLNPGSLSLPRGNSTKSYAIIRINGEEINVEIKNLK